MTHSGSTSQYVLQYNNTVIINGEKLPPCPVKSGNSTIINNKVFIGGYEWTGTEWKKTLRALWHKYF